MDLDDEDFERLQEIRSLPREVVVDSINWWNHDADEGMKRFIVASTYYEILTQMANDAEKALEQWENDGIL